MAVEEERVEVPSDDGAKIALWKVGSGPPLLLVHATATDHTRWRPLYPALAAHFTVYAMDRRGRGGSSDGPAYDYRREFEDVSEALTRIGPEANLLGHGWGAICALGAVRRVPQSYVRRLVLYEPPIPMDGGPSMVPSAVVEKIQARVGVGDRDRAVSAFLVDVCGLSGAELEEQKTLPAWLGRLGSAKTVPRELRAHNDFRLDVDAYRDLQVPTLLLEGDRSPDHIRRAVHWVQQTIPASRVVAFPGQKHHAMDVAQDLFLQTVLSFLSS